uniref:t-SNARE coiled-coil homology domain-containing protein n=2 Tax=Caenorhabditis japonica TaxID=281687 RepID=A0A8R1I0X7_CAEJA
MQSLESSLQMIQDLEQMNIDGVQTVAALEDQDEQLDKIEANLSKVNDDLNVVSHNVTDMEHCGCNIFRILCAPFKYFRKRESDIIKEEVLEKFTNNKLKQKDDDTVIFRSSNKRRESTGDFLKRLTCDTIEDELEKNLIHIDQGIECVKNLAIDMHVQLKIQEPKLDRIEELTETNDSVVEGVNDKVKKLLH